MRTLHAWILRFGGSFVAFKDHREQANPRCSVFSKCTTTHGKERFSFSEYPIHRMLPRARSMVKYKFIGFTLQLFHLRDDFTFAETLLIPLSYQGIQNRNNRLSSPIIRPVQHRWKEGAVSGVSYPEGCNNWLWPSGRSLDSDASTG